MLLEYPAEISAAAARNKVVTAHSAKENPFPLRGKHLPVIPPPALGATDSFWKPSSMGQLWVAWRLPLKQSLSQGALWQKRHNNGSRFYEHHEVVGADNHQNCHLILFAILGSVIQGHPEQGSRSCCQNSQARADTTTDYRPDIPCTSRGLSTQKTRLAFSLNRGLEQTPGQCV